MTTLSAAALELRAAAAELLDEMASEFASTRANRLRRAVEAFDATADAALGDAMEQARRRRKGKR